MATIHTGKQPYGSPARRVAQGRRSAMMAAAWPCDAHTKLSTESPGDYQTMAKAIREKIKLVSSAGTGYFYTTTKNRKLHPDKMTVKKYDPKVRKHVEFTEQRMK